MSRARGQIEMAYTRRSVRVSNLVNKGRKVDRYGESIIGLLSFCHRKSTSSSKLDVRISNNTNEQQSHRGPHSQATISLMATQAGFEFMISRATHGVHAHRTPPLFALLPRKGRRSGVEMTAWNNRPTCWKRVPLFVGRKRTKWTVYFIRNNSHLWRSTLPPS